jgi:hypothetical protein
MLVEVHNVTLVLVDKFCNSSQYALLVGAVHQQYGRISLNIHELSV